jgi:Ran GTPase-activating protein (RanGAP) involved in mRNA processing and transport
MDSFARELEQISNDEAGDTVSLFGCAVGEQGALALADALASSRTVTALSLSSCQVGAAAALASALPRCRALRILHLQNDVSVGDAGALALGTALSSPTTQLTELCLVDCGVGDEGAAGIAEGLRGNSNNNNNSNQTLLTLGLAENPDIGDAGFRALGAALASSTTALAELSLTSCGGGAGGVEALCEGLRANKTLRVLDLGHNRIGDAGARAIGASLASNSVLAQLVLFRCGVQSDGAVALAEGLRSCRALEKLNLQYNLIGEAGIGAIASLLATHPSLASLHLGDCGLDSEGARR